MVYKFFSGRKRRQGQGAVRMDLFILSDKLFYLLVVCFFVITQGNLCLVYTSDAADELDGVDLGGRRIIKKGCRRFKRL